MEPSGLIQMRRARLLLVLSRASVPLSTQQLSKRLGWSLATTRAHLHALVSDGAVERFNYRRWSASPTAKE